MSRLPVFFTSLPPPVTINQVRPSAYVSFGGPSQAIVNEEGRPVINPKEALIAGLQIPARSRAFPLISTLLQPIPLAYPVVVSEVDSFTKPFAPGQKSIVIDGKPLDYNRISAARTTLTAKKEGREPYSVAQLKEIARHLDLPLSQNKAALADAIRSKLGLT